MMRQDVQGGCLIILTREHARSEAYGGPIPVGACGRVTRQRFNHEERQRETAVILGGYGQFFVGDWRFRLMTRQEIEDGCSG